VIKARGSGAELEPRAAAGALFADSAVAPARPAPRRWARRCTSTRMTAPRTTRAGRIAPQVPARHRHDQLSHAPRVLDRDRAPGPGSRLQHRARVPGRRLAAGLRHRTARARAVPDRPRDAIGIRFAFQPERNTDLLVRPDGKVSMPLARRSTRPARPRPSSTRSSRSSWQAPEEPGALGARDGFAAQKVFVGARSTSRGRSTSSRGSRRSEP
jgi:hypothetical protein